MNLMRFVVASMVPLSFVGGRALYAQGAGLSAIEDPNIFLERSYVSPFMPTGKGLILEGQSSTHFWIRNDLSDQTWLRRGGWKWGNVPVSMIFVVRIFKDFSSPVRTPSSESRFRPIT